LANADSRTDLLLRVRLSKGAEDTANPGLELEAESSHGILTRFHR